MKKKTIMTMILSLMLAACLCACSGQAATTSDTGSSNSSSTTEATEETVEIDVTWPEDNGGLAGVYKWVEMENTGITANLILFDDGTGIFDMLGVVESVKYDDSTMQSSGEGALPQEYTYEDGTLTWVTSDKDRDVSTFVKLTKEELSEYEKRGIGNGK